MVDRRNLTVRDMTVAVGILVVSLIAVVGAMGGISLGSDTDSGAAPTADVVGGFERAGAALKLPIVVPTGLPSTWQPSSFTQVDPVTAGGTRTVVRGGWLTGDGKFVTLIQSPESPVVLVSNEVGQGLASTASVAAGGATWTVFPGQRTESVWVRSEAGVALLITGSAGEDDFRILAAAVG